MSRGELAKRPIEYDAGFTLLPGKYTIKFLAREHLSPSSLGSAPGAAS